MLITSIQTAIQEIEQIAKQSSALATGLQNAAPPGTSLQSVKYLLEIAIQLEKASHDIQELLQNDQAVEQNALQRLTAVAEQDEILRKKYEIADKFRFVRERLQAVLQQLEQALQIIVKEADKHIKKDILLEDEVALYVYLYNARGTVLSSWQNLLIPKAFYEYSINRPVYIEKSHVETLLRSKTNKTQHAYLTIAVKTVHIIQSDTSTKDSLGNPLVKIKEGSLSLEKLICFVCNNQEYILNDRGELTKKQIQ